MIRVENRRTYKGEGEYVGRPSPLGNPFKIGNLDGNRMEVIGKYEEWLKRNDCTKQVTTELRRLTSLYKREGQLTLICWCAPLPCHADVIARYIKKLAKTDRFSPSDWVYMPEKRWIEK